MRVRPLWIILALLILPPLLTVIGWRMLPKAGMTGQCGSVSRIVPAESDAVAFSMALRTAILDNPGGPFQLRTTDDELTSYIALETRGRQLADPQIHFFADTVCLSGRVVGLGLMKPLIRVEARLYVVESDIQVDIRSLTVNGRVPPAWLRRLVQRVTNESIRDALLPVRVNAIQMRHGEIVISGERLTAPQ